ncbi:hypothetical protein MRB53_030665 [Persea americana]|uniref:Uncharacterized protein n=1 Tax=Persea americana TaxID=3435 RepID=A0ACC2KLU0_PERAE|nr:hypothetical protein MRB53_030665 [Persea americana]
MTGLIQKSHETCLGILSEVSTKGDVNIRSKQRPQRNALGCGTSHHLCMSHQPIHLIGHFSLLMLCLRRPPSMPIMTLHLNMKPAKWLARLGQLPLHDGESTV